LVLFPQEVKLNAARAVRIKMLFFFIFLFCIDGLVSKKVWITLGYPDLLC
jgi:hypothetical protein